MGDMQRMGHTNEPPLINLGGDGLQIKRIPLDEEFVRLEALKCASFSARDQKASNILHRAAMFEEYIHGGQKVDQVFSDEGTISRVRDILVRAGFLKAAADEAIDSLLNSGVVFREVRSL